MIINPRTKIPLNGPWQLQPSNTDVVPTEWNHTVPVPALVDIAAPKYDWKSFKYHWHRTTFEVAKKSDLAFIVIEQAMFGTDVWLNGKHLGGDIACYTSQEYDARRAIRTGKTNELIIRVGQREHLPPESAVGKDQERTDWISGIWGDVYLLQCGNPRVQLVQVIPHIKAGITEVRVTVENRSGKAISCSLSSTILRKKQKTTASQPEKKKLTVKRNSTEVVVFKQKITQMKLWSPTTPFLYEAETTVKVGNKKLDSLCTTFGMREFKVVGADLYLNGNRIFLRGGNIAFHRFLSDADRGTLPWNLDWVKKLLIDIPKANNFNFFRNHIGQMYNRWYDIADEYGMLLQNEWMFWTTTGTREQITKEFTRWLQDNWNHPSIIIWDALNECSDDVVQKEIVPEMKQLDPTRPWESVDFTEDHPYIYSLGPVLNSRKFGFTRSLDEIERASTPTMLNEFCWWWLDKDFNPTLLMKDVVERWLGPNWTKEQLIAHQSFLVTELVELFRRMRVDAIQPFVYLSNNAGPTGNWFVGDIKELCPKPILAALKNVFAPFGVSMELWDRHFVPNERRFVRVFVFNDEPKGKSGILRYGTTNAKGEWRGETKQSVVVGASVCEIIPVTIQLPPLPGDFRLRVELYESDKLVSVSEKCSHVIGATEIPHRLREARLALLAKGNELNTFLGEIGLKSVSFSCANLNECDVLIVGEGMLPSPSYQVWLGAITTFLDSGKTVVLIEPESGVEKNESVTVVPGVELAFEKRTDADKGGYDSYVFAEDAAHPLWQGIPDEHLHMFNGGYGGEVVSQHNVVPSVEHVVHARCGLSLSVAAVCEIPVGKGRVIVSRLQSRGRLVKSSEPDSLYVRRVDPVMQNYVVNLLSYASRGAAHD